MSLLGVLRLDAALHSIAGGDVHRQAMFVVMVDEVCVRVFPDDDVDWKFASELPQ